MRFYCSITGLEENWVEVSQVWTRRELRELVEANGEQLLELLRHKLTACHITRVDGAGAITDPAELSEAILDEVDIRVVDFLGSVLVQAGAHLRSLGNLSGRLLSDGAAVTAQARQTP